MKTGPDQGWVWELPRKWHLNSQSTGKHFREGTGDQPWRWNRHLEGPFGRMGATQAGLGVGRVIKLETVPSVWGAQRRPEE